MLDSRSWHDRWCALYAVSSDICDEESLPLIRRHLRDPAKRVRKAAKAALARLSMIGSAQPAWQLRRRLHPPGLCTVR